MAGLGVTTFWQNKRVALTGHTGFKGSWLSLWLTESGAEVHGFALEPDTEPALFQQLDLASGLRHSVGDIRNADAIRKWLIEAQPEVVFHLAAQPLVRRSYREARHTWDTNVMGTIHLLESLRNLKNPCAVVVVTTDKVYENREQPHAYREVDRLGGHDPYSSSKAATELAVASWRSSFFSPNNLVRVATARAGNVIGGGDWSEDRIVPDLVRALADGHPIPVRNPRAVRPWQHVLEPLSGYLLLAQKLWESNKQSLQDAFNFGPGGDTSKSVQDLVEATLKYWPGSWKNVTSKDSLHEVREISLSTEKAKSQLGWTPRWAFHETVENTVHWYKNYYNQTPPRELTLQQIKGYSQT